MSGFETKMNEWLHDQLTAEKNLRRRELLQKEIGHGTKEFLRTIWYPAVGNFNHLYAEWEVRDYGNRYRYLDLAYMPGGAKGCIEIHGYRSHARDIEAWRFMVYVRNKRTWYWTVGCSCLWRICRSRKNRRLSSRWLCPLSESLYPRQQIIRSVGLKRRLCGLRVEPFDLFTPMSLPCI